jgi:arylsulfatase A-like enzyme
MDKMRPNILLIVTDQHRLAALGCYGATPCQTPNIDRLAREGVRFETAYTTCPVCSPARASIMTGQFPSSHGVTMNVGSLGAVWNLPDHERMLPRQLQRQGYRCGYTGKWHLCPSEPCREWFSQSIPHHVPGDFGFEGQNFMGHGGGGFNYPEYREYLAGRGLGFSLEPGTENPKEMGWPGFAVQEGPKEATVDHFLAGHTISLLDRFREAGEPFFIWHNHWGPHEPYYPVEEFYDLYRDMPIPPWTNFEVPDGLLGPQHLRCRHPRAGGREWAYWERALRYYYAFTTQIDHEIGRILDHLDQTGLSENTVVIFTSDHGEAIGSHGGMINKGYSHFEETQRIGMIVRHPDKLRPAGVAPGAVRKEMASLLDIYPTCLDLAGGHRQAQEAEGGSLHALLEGAPARESVFVEFFGLATPAAMVTCRHGRWKYGWNATSGDELYDLEGDPLETVNRVHDPSCRAICREMLERIAGHLPAGLRSDVLHQLQFQDQTL